MREHQRAARIRSGLLAMLVATAAAAASADDGAGRRAPALTSGEATRGAVAPRSGPVVAAGERIGTDAPARGPAAIDWNALPFQWAITMKRGDGRRRIAIFSDPNCPFCRRFETDLELLDDITVYVFPYAVLGPQSVRQAKAVWCSRDRAKAWNDLMQNRIEPVAQPDCATPIEELIALGRRLGAVATPTWFLPNGEKHAGAMPLDRLEPLLDAAARTR